MAVAALFLFFPDLLKKDKWGSCSMPDSRGSYRNEEVWSVTCLHRVSWMHQSQNAWDADLCQVQGIKLLTLSQAYVQCSATLRHHPSMRTSPWSLNTFLEVTKPKPVRCSGVICSPSHCSLTVALAEAEDTTVAAVEYLEPRTAPAAPATGLDVWGTWAAEALGHVVSSLPTSSFPLETVP